MTSEVSTGRAAAEAWLSAIESLDEERILNALADDVEIHVEGMERPLVGLDTLRSLLPPDLADVYESVRVEPLHLVASGDEAALLVRASATMRSNVELLGETLPTEGKHLSVTAALFLEVNEAGKIARLTRVRDNLEIIRQLDVPPERMRSILAELERRLRTQTAA